VLDAPNPIGGLVFPNARRNRLPKIGCLFPPKSTMELYKYSMLNTKNVSSQQTEMTIKFVSVIL